VSEGCFVLAAVRQVLARACLPVQGVLELANTLAERRLLLNVSRVTTRGPRCLATGERPPPPPPPLGGVFFRLGRGGGSVDQGGYADGRRMLDLLVTNSTVFCA